jgi:hypothetical protein
LIYAAAPSRLCVLDQKHHQESDVVVAVLITSCHVPAKWNGRPVTAANRQNIDEALMLGSLKVVKPDNRVANGHWGRRGSGLT